MVNRLGYLAGIGNNGIYLIAGQALYVIKGEDIHRVSHRQGEGAAEFGNRNYLILPADIRRDYF